jgi:hypothetical protein
VPVDRTHALAIAMYEQNQGHLERTGTPTVDPRFTSTGVVYEALARRW